MCYNLRYSYSAFVLSVLKQPQHWHFWKDVLDDVLKLFDGAVRRFATALDTECKSKFKSFDLIKKSFLYRHDGPKVAGVDAWNRWTDLRLMRLMVQYHCLYSTYQPAEGEATALRVGDITFVIRHIQCSEQVEIISVQTTFNIDEFL